MQKAPSTPKGIDIDSLVESETWKLNQKVPLRPVAAIHVLREAAGLTDQRIDELFPDLRGFSGMVKLDVSNKNNPPVVISIAEASANPSGYVQLWYSYVAEEDKAYDLIDLMPKHPRTKIKEVLAGSWSKQEAPLGDPEAAKRFLGRAA